MKTFRVFVQAAILASSIVSASDLGSLKPMFKKLCIDCHGAEEQEGKVRLDQLSGKLEKGSGEAELFLDIVEQLEIGEMPPEDETQPSPSERNRMIKGLKDMLSASGYDSEAGRAFPEKGNYLAHELLFGGEDSGTGADAASPARIWRISPHAYYGMLDELTFGPATTGGQRRRIATLPFGLSSDPGIQDYAFRYTVTGSEIEQMVRNAKVTIDHLLKKQGRFRAPELLGNMRKSKEPPSPDEIEEAVEIFFDLVLKREPDEEETDRYEKLLTDSISRFGNHDGLVRGLSPLLYHPETVFRIELGNEGQPSGVRTLLPSEQLATAIAYALTDRRPDPLLAEAVKKGNLVTRADVEREVKRILANPEIEKPRILRFFQEYFGYAAAPEIFKDESIHQAAGFPKYRPEGLVADTDRLVLHILSEDREVLHRLLTTNLSYVGSHLLENWRKFANRRAKHAADTGEPEPTSPFNKFERHNRYYNFPAEKWKDAMPLFLPPEQRAGILTQPSWLIANSTNTDNHAIHRGKWIREHLLGGFIPDTPITVEAKLPEEPGRSLRHRMRVTREAYCWKCHKRMDPLGLPFEMFDPFGRFRTEEAGKPVDSSGEVMRSGEAGLDGPVENAIELMRRLADSERVHQVFVRYAFRYWMGRNETLEDAPALRAAHHAYRGSGGSMNALIVSILTSDPFLYRISQ